MKTIFLVIAPGRQSTEALHYALHKTKEMHATLKVVYVVEPEATSDLVAAKKVLEAVEKQARTFQVPVESALKEGSYLQICGELSQSEGAALMIVTENKDSFLKKVFEGSETKKLKDRISCEIKVYPS